MSDNKALGFIAARGGSTRLKRKNLAKIGGKPLVAYTLESALKSKCFHKIVLSTDNKEIAEVATKYKKILIDKRPKYLSTSNATALNTVLEFMKRQKIAKFQSIALMLPTCPFRDEKDIKQGFSKLTRNVDSVISITSYEFPYEMSLTGDKHGTIKPFFKPSPLISGNTRSQDQIEYYRPNGGFYISWWSSMIRYANFFGGKIQAYYMDKERSVDIDTKIDLQIARMIFKNLKK